MSRGEGGNAMRTKFITASQTIGASDVQLRGRFLVTDNRPHLILPAPSAALELQDQEAKIVNSTADWLTVECPNSDFNGNVSQVCVDPYGQLNLEYTRDVPGAGYQVDYSGVTRPTLVSSHTAALAWTTATPGASTITKTFRYTYLNGIVFFDAEVSTTDGAGATQLTISLPITPQNLSMKTPIKGVKTIDGTATDCLAYIASDQATEANRVLTFASFGTWTDNKTCSVKVSGWYAVRGFTTYTPTLAWGTGTPASITTVGVFKVVENMAFVLYQSTSANNNGCTSLTVSLPETVPPDTGAYPAISALALSNATYTNPYGYVDCDNGTAGSRLIGFSGFPSCSGGEAVGMSVAAVYEIDGGQDFSADLAPTWTTGTPASLTTSARYRVIGGQYCWFEVYLTSADSNGCTDLVMVPPLTPALDTGDVQLNCYVLNNATPVFPAAYIDADQATPANRTIKCSLFPTCTDAATVTVRVSGIYRVAA